MVRKTALFLMLVVAMLTALVLPAALVPAPAKADINSVLWLNTAFKGNDPMLGYVQAYQTGATATLLVSFQNTMADTLTIKGAKVKFDWANGEYAATAGNFPTTLASGESGTATITVTVPTTGVSNQVTHAYTVSVDYDKEGGFKVGTQVTRENLYGYTTYSLDNGPVDPATLQVYVGGSLASASSYTLACGSYSPTITFTTVPTGSVNADYQYCEMVTSYANGVDTSYQLDHYPVVASTLKVYVDCTATTAYTLDADTGKIKFTTAPASGKSIVANYQYVARWTSSNDDFAVYSSDQNAAMGVKQKLVAIASPEVATAGSRKLLADSAMEEQLGDQQYAAGNLDQAKAQYDQAFADLDKALKNDNDSNAYKPLEPTGTLLLGIGMVLLALGVIIYVLRRPKGPSGV